MREMLCPFSSTAGLLCYVRLKNHKIGEMLFFHSVCLRVPTVLKLLKMAVGMRALLDTVMQALPQVRAAK